MAAEHDNLLSRALVDLSKEGFKLWRNETGKAKSMDGQRIISYGKPGSSDIIGTAPNGTSVYIEVKIPPDDLKTDQIIFRDIMIKQYAIYAKITPENYTNEIKRVSREGKARITREIFL